MASTRAVEQFQPMLAIPSADLVALSSKSISGNKFVASVKQLNIGAVPNRGGIPSDRLNGQGQPRATAPGREFHKKCRLK
ncbi:hypothetical protein WJX75_008224 [Coccomyxa subellipsoidea]|uniref:Uncharacterized protein n=1 Tax=Coccomyxa subellipsoidea TaxID=248742 RepID=A0ABR2YFZ1_9CHLO